MMNFSKFYFEFVIRDSKNPQVPIFIQIGQFFTTLICNTEPPHFYFLNFTRFVTNNRESHQVSILKFMNLEKFFRQNQ